jgi:hypothetical protein
MRAKFDGFLFSPGMTPRRIPARLQFNGTSPGSVRRPYPESQMIPADKDPDKEDFPLSDTLPDPG